MISRSTSGEVEAGLARAEMALSVRSADLMFMFGLVSGVDLGVYEE